MTGAPGNEIADLDKVSGGAESAAKRRVCKVLEPFAVHAGFPISVLAGAEGVKRGCWPTNPALGSSTLK